MPGAQPRRSTTSRMAASARRGANVPAGVPGVYRVPRRVYVATTPDSGAAGQANPWIQPEDATIEQGMTLRRMVSRGPDMDGFVNDQARWEASLLGAFDGFDLSGSPFSVTMYYGESPVIYDAAQVQQSQYVTSFLLGPVEPDPGDWPPGATGVEYETPTGTATSDVTVSGLFQYGLNAAPTPIDDYGWTIYATSDEQAWYTRAEVGGLSVVEAIPYPGNFTSTPYSFTVPHEDTIRFLYQWDAVTLSHLSAVGTTDAGSIFMDTTPAASVTYRPPRYRFTF